jgi:hypothetical protein
MPVEIGAELIGKIQQSGQIQGQKLLSTPSLPVPKTNLNRGRGRKIYRIKNLSDKMVSVHADFAKQLEDVFINDGTGRPVR